MYYVLTNFSIPTYSKRIGSWRWCKNSQNWFQSEIAWKVITVCLTTGVSWKSIQLIHDKHFTWLWSHAGEIWGKLSGKISYHRSFRLVQPNLKIMAEQIVENFPLVVNLTCRDYQKIMYGTFFLKKENNLAWIQIGIDSYTGQLINISIYRQTLVLLTRTLRLVLHCTKYALFGV